MANQESPLPKLDSLVTAIHNTLQNKFDGKASQSELTAHIDDTSIHLSSNDRAKVNDILTATSAQSTYTLKSTFNSHKNNNNIHVTAAQMAEWDSKAAGTHTHDINDITGLQNTLDSKAADVHTHDINDITGLQNTLDSKAADVHTHDIDDITGLSNTLTGLQNTLDSKAAGTHTHAIDDITGLSTIQNTLDSKASDNAVVHKSGAETITGTKTFKTPIVGDITGNANTCTVRFINLVNSNEDLATVLGFVPPTLADIFNTWYRFSHANNYVQYNEENAEGDGLLDMQAWSYDASRNVVENSRNTPTYVGFISPLDYDKYTIIIKIGSAFSTSDNDMLTIIVGYMKDANGIEHTISITRDGGRNEGTNGPIPVGNMFSIAYDTNYTGFAEPKILLADGSNLVNIASRWHGHYALLKVERIGSTIIAQTTEVDSNEFTATLVYTLPSTRSDDMSEEDYNNIKYMLTHKSPIGFGLFSQKGDFELLEMSNIYDGLNIYDAANDVIYAYQNGSYVQTDRKVSDELEDYTRAYNKNIKKEFIYYDGVAYESSSSDTTSNAANDGTLTITVNDTTAGTFSANQESNASINVAVPTMTSQLTNDSDYLTSDAVPRFATDGEIDDLATDFNSLWGA